MIKQRNELYLAMIQAIATIKGESYPSDETMIQAYDISKNASNLAIDNWFNRRHGAREYWVSMGVKEGAIA